MACKNLTNLNTKISNLKNVNILAELLKRVPSNQLEQFVDFRDMCQAYQARVDKFPEKLPKIDWEYYRTNVRKDYTKMVDDFEKKYEELNKIFDNRAQVDTKMYFKEVDKVKSDVKVEVEKFIKESNERIKIYEQEIEKLRNMIPYEQMTCEDFCVNLPENAHLLGVGGESFWPHTAEEQLGYVAPEQPLNEEEKHMQEDIAEAQHASEAQQQQAGKPITAEVPQPSPTPSQEKPDTAASTSKPKTAEVPQPSPAKEKPESTKSTPSTSKTAEVPQPLPAKEKPSSKETPQKPTTAEVPQPMPVKEKPDPKKATPPKPKTAELPQPSPAKEKPSSTAKEAEKKPSTKKKETDKKDDPKNDGEKK